MLYELKSGGFTAQVDSFGAQIMSLKGKDGSEYLWTGNPAYWKSRAPVLFPIVGALRGGKTTIDGKWYEMGQHGIARHLEFALCEQTENSLSLVLRSDQGTKKQYPFDFRFTVTYTLHANKIETRFMVENTGEKTLPFAVGGHPGFNVPVGEPASFEDYTIVFEKRETQRCPVIDETQGLIDDGKTGFTLDKEQEIPLRHSLFYHDALVFEGLSSSTVRVVNKQTGRGVEMEFSQFPMLGIWSSKNDGPYVCLEPWTGCATRLSEGDEFQEKKGMTLLPPGEKKAYSFSVEIL